MESVIQFVIDVVGSNPKTAGFLAVIPVLQGIGWLLARFLPAHTIAAKVGEKVAAFPVRLPGRTSSPGVGSDAG